MPSLPFLDIPCSRASARHEAVALPVLCRRILAAALASSMAARWQTLPVPIPQGGREMENLRRVNGSKSNPHSEKRRMPCVKISGSSSTLAVNGALMTKRSEKPQNITFILAVAPQGIKRYVQGAFSASVQGVPGHLVCYRRLE